MDGSEISVSKNETVAPNFLNPEQEYSIRIHGAVLDDITPVELLQLRDLINVFMESGKS